MEYGEAYPEEETQVSQNEDAFREDDGNEVFFEDKTDDIIIDAPPAGTVMPELSVTDNKMKAASVKEQKEAESPSLTKGKPEDDTTAVSAKAQQEEETAAEEKQPEIAPVVLAEEHQRVEKKQVNSVFDNVLSQGLDGQISLVVPQDVVIEKQITGQMNLQELFLEWENVKKRKEEERRAKTSKDIIEKTGKIFAEFEAGARTGPLAKIEEERKMFASKFQNNEIELRSIDAIEKISYTQGSIWDEVDAAIEADRKKLEEENSPEAEANDTEVTEDGAGLAAGAVFL